MFFSPRLTNSLFGENFENDLSKIAGKTLRHQGKMMPSKHEMSINILIKRKFQVVKTLFLITSFSYFCMQVCLNKASAFSFLIFMHSANLLYKV